MADGKNWTDSARERVPVGLQAGTKRYGAWPSDSSQSGSGVKRRRKQNSFNKTKSKKKKKNKKEKKTSKGTHNDIFS